MVQESILEKDFIFLIQTKSRNLEQRLSGSIPGEDIRFLQVKRSEDVMEQPDGEIIIFLIGSDIEDPVQSAQRLHTLKKNAKIILLSASDEGASTLKEVLNFSPFIGTDVHCLSEADEEELDSKLKEILHNSLQAAKYRAIVAESQSKVPAVGASQKPAYNQQFINKLMDIAPIGIAITDREGRILGWNKEATSIFQLNEAQVLGKVLSRLFAQNDGRKLEDFLKRSFEKRSNVSGEPLLLERNAGDKSKQIFSFTATPFVYSAENEKALILAIKDETERELARYELQKMNETLEERVKKRTASLLSYQEQLRSLASQLSKTEENERQRLATELHDNLGQMLALARMKIGSLQNYPLSGQLNDDILEVIGLMDEALSYTRNLMSDLKPPPSLNQEDISGSIEWLASKMKSRDLHVIIEDDGKPKPVDDEVRSILVQCVRELFWNVIKHADVDEAQVRMIRMNDKARIEVEDKGIGFDPDQTSPSYENGFGLFNISERIDLLGGRMDIDSEKGRGTKITLMVPLTEKAIESSEPSVEKNEPDSPGNRTKKVKVMLVDDHKMMREGLREIVNEQPDLVVVAEASNGEEALKVAEKVSPDIIVMDVNMPVMDGIEATRKLSEKMPDVRVIGLSFHDHPKVKDSMRDSGATAYLNKNEAFETLCATIRSEVRQPGD